MDDLISRQAAIDALVKQTNLTWEHLKTIYPMLNVFEKLPSAERHGRWIRDEFGSRCGACGLYAYRDKFDKPWESPYCPNCGAKMDEVENDDK